MGDFWGWTEILMTIHKIQGSTQSLKLSCHSAPNTWSTGVQPKWPGPAWIPVWAVEPGFPQWSRSCPGGLGWKWLWVVLPGCKEHPGKAVGDFMLFACSSWGTQSCQKLVYNNLEELCISAILSRHLNTTVCKVFWFCFWFGVSFFPFLSLWWKQLPFSFEHLWGKKKKEKKRKTPHKPTVTWAG